MTSRQTTDKPDHVFDRAGAKADEIEAEMRRIGYWQADPVRPEALRFTRPFAADTMTFAQWLQFVFLPKVRELVQRRQQVPDSSTVGAYAVRELDKDASADQLVTLLMEFDSLFGTPKIDYGGTVAGGAGGRPRPRFTRGVRMAAWTVVLVAAAVLCVGYGSRLAPPVRHARYSFSVHDPASGGYEAIELTATADGPAGRVRPGSLQLRMYPSRDPVPGGDMAVDLQANTYTYSGADGRPQSGPLDPTAVLAWMRRCGITGDERALSAEAAALADFTRDVSRDPAAAFDRTRAAGGTSTGPAAAPFRLSAIGNVERESPGEVPLWIRLAVPGLVWGVGLGLIARGGRRQGGAPVAGGQPAAT